MKKAKIWSFLMVILLVVFLASCGSGEDSSTEENNAGENEAKGEETSTIPTIKDGYFTFGFSGLFKPFNYENLDGDLTGFEVELGRALAEEMGLKPNPVATQDFGALIEEVNSGRLDAIMGSMTITEERAEAVDFSDPYYLSGGVIFTHTDTNDIDSLEDLKGKNVGVVASSTYEDIVLEHIAEDNLKTYQSDNVALQDLSAGTDRLDAVMTDKFVGLIQKEENNLNIKAVTDRVYDEEIGAAVKKGNQELLDEINRALNALIEDGTYEKISNEWFGENILE